MGNVRFHLGKSGFLPTRASEYSCALDLRTPIGVFLEPGERMTVPLSLWWSPSDPSVFALLKEKSGLASKKGLMCLGGVIDGDYRGEIMVIVYNSDRDSSIIINAGEKICQMLISVPFIDFEEGGLYPVITTRQGGLGSTGA